MNDNTYKACLVICITLAFMTVALTVAFASPPAVFDSAIQIYPDRGATMDPCGGEK